MSRSDYWWQWQKKVTIQGKVYKFEEEKKSHSLQWKQKYKIV